MRFNERLIFRPWGCFRCSALSSVPSGIEINARIEGEAKKSKSALKRVPEFRMGLRALVEDMLPMSPG